MVKSVLQGAHTRRSAVAPATIKLLAGYYVPDKESSTYNSYNYFNTFYRTFQNKCFVLQKFCENYAKRQRHIIVQSDGHLNDEPPSILCFLFSKPDILHVIRHFFRHMIKQIIPAALPALVPGLADLGLCGFNLLLKSQG